MSLVVLPLKKLGINKQLNSAAKSFIWDSDGSFFGNQLIQPASGTYGRKVANKYGYAWTEQRFNTAAMPIDLYSTKKSPSFTLILSLVPLTNSTPSDIVIGVSRQNGDGLVGFKLVNDSSQRCINFRISVNSAQPLQFITSTVPWNYLEGKLYTVVVTLNKSKDVAKMFMNGELIGTASGLPAAAFADNNAITSNFTGGYPDQYKLFAAIDEVLSDQDALALSSNPDLIYGLNVGIMPAEYSSNVLPLKPSSYCTEQPQSTAKINWSNPITRGLILAVLPNSQVNAVTGLPFLVNFSSTYRTIGSAFGLVSDLGYIAAREPSSVGQPGSEFDLTTDITCLYYGFQSTTQNSSDTFSRGQGSATISGWAIGLHGGSSNGAYAAYAGTTLAPTGTFANVTKPTVSVLTAGSGNASLYCNGLLQQSSAVGTPTYQYSPGSVRCVMFGSTTGMLNPSNNKSLVGLLWNRKLSEIEIKEISANPWQVFESEVKYEPKSIEIPYVPVPNLSLAQLINVLSTSAQPKVTLTF